jgi:hypothetical protein
MNFSNISFMIVYFCQCVEPWQVIKKQVICAIHTTNMNTRTLETWIFRGNLTKINFDNVTNTFNDFVLVSRGSTSLS